MGGSAPMTCDEVNAAYTTQVIAAKECDGSIDVPQCTDTVGSDLVCMCETTINPINSAALAQLAALQMQWDDMMCVAGVACACAPPPSGVCAGEPGTGLATCTDVIN